MKVLPSRPPCKGMAKSVRAMKRSDSAARRVEGQRSFRIDSV